MQGSLRSPIFCSQIDPSGWHIKLGNDTFKNIIEGKGYAHFVVT